MKGYRKTRSILGLICLFLILVIYLVGLTWFLMKVIEWKDWWI